MQTLANQIQLITKFATKAWDEVYKAESRAALLSKGQGRVRFSVDNARIVKVAKIALGGLSDYIRNNVDVAPGYEGILPDIPGQNGIKRGYQEAAVSLVWETRELTQDRGAKYAIEILDDEETGDTTVTATATEINRTVVVPEVDAYCFSKIASEVQKYGLGN